MANPNRVSKPDIEKSEQELLNKSFDREFDVLATENLVYNPTSGTLDRMTQPASDTTLTQLQYTMSEIQQYMAAIAAAKGIAADIRVTLLSGTVTTVGTLSNITSIGGINATPLPQNINNSTAIQSNISNVIVS